MLKKEMSRRIKTALFTELLDRYGEDERELSRAAGDRLTPTDTINKLRDKVALRRKTLIEAYQAEL